MAPRSVPSSAGADVASQWHKTLRRWPTVLGVWLAVLALAVLTGLLWPLTYKATASLVVTPPASKPLTSNWSDEEIELRTEEATLGSRQVALRAAAILEGVQPDEADSVLARQLIGASETVAPSQSQVLRVSVANADPDLAAEQANALAEAYLAVRADIVTTSSAEAISRLDESITALERTDPEGEALEELRTERASLSLVSPTPGRIITPAVAPSSPSSPGLAAFGAGGLAGGLVLGLIAGVLHERLDRRVRHPERLAEAIDCPVVTVESADDEFGALELLRRLDPANEGSVPPSDARIAVYAAHEETAALVVEALRGVVLSWGGIVRLVDWDDLQLGSDSVHSEPDWGALTGTPPFTLFMAVEPSPATLSQLAALSDRVDGLVIPVGAEEDLGRSRRRLIGVLGRRATVVPVFIPSPRKRAGRNPKTEV